MKNDNELLASAKITSKGQITVPKNIRNMLEVSDGDSIVFFKDQNSNIHIISKKNLKVLPEDNKTSIIVRGGKKNG